ncbi:MAG: tRNA (adenosine(37)-N6)-threonylcarbamoyltransferase complex ATPase subunit type 1 TsaE [Patescibacteria group bacterium]
MKKTITSVEEMGVFVNEFLTKIGPGSQAVVVGLSGDLGSGKTTFVQGVARALGVTEYVTSPTFVIQKTYTPQKQFKKLIHIDAYRITNKEELSALRFQETVTSPNTLIFVEWPERVGDVLPPDIKHLSFLLVNEETRIVDDGA